MRGSELDQVLARCAEADKTFVYFKDRYALLLLSWAAGRDGCVRRRELGKGRFGPLLSKPAIARVLSRAGSGVVDAGELRAFRADQRWRYRLEFDRWGALDERDYKPSWHQTSRPGFNLVVRLNFTRDHNRAYHALIQPNGRQPYQYAVHPNSSRHATLGWARVDLELDAGEALIEEVQTDWIKEALLERDEVESSIFDPEASSYTGVHPFCVVAYVESVLRPHADVWAEALLSATIEVVRGTLGIRRIFFNSFETGCRLKELEGSRPPRWLYSSLPRKFCFRRTSERPRALSRCRHRPLRAKLRQDGLEWFLLELD